MSIWGDHRWTGRSSKHWGTFTPGGIPMAGPTGRHSQPWSMATVLPAMHTGVSGRTRRRACNSMYSGTCGAPQRRAENPHTPRGRIGNSHPASRNARAVLCGARPGKQLGQVFEGGDHPVLLPQGVDHPHERAPHRPRVRTVHQVGVQIGGESAHSHILPEGCHKPLVAAPSPLRLVSTSPSQSDRYSSYL